MEEKNPNDALSYARYGVASSRTSSRQELLRLEASLVKTFEWSLDMTENMVVLGL